MFAGKAIDEVDQLLVGFLCILVEVLFVDLLQSELFPAIMCIFHILIKLLKQIEAKRRIYITPGLVEQGEKTEEERLGPRSRHGQHKGRRKHSQRGPSQNFFIPDKQIQRKQGKGAGYKAGLRNKIAQA